MDPKAQITGATSRNRDAASDGIRGESSGQLQRNRDLFRRRRRRRQVDGNHPIIRRDSGAKSMVRSTVIEIAGATAAGRVTPAPVGPMTCATIGADRTAVALSNWRPAITTPALGRASSAISPGAHPLGVRVGDNSGTPNMSVTRGMSSHYGRVPFSVTGT